MHHDTRAYLWDYCFYLLPVQKELAEASAVLATPFIVHLQCYEIYLRGIQMSWSKIMLYLGILLIVLSQLTPFLMYLGLGKLPGDIFFQTKNVTVYFPWISCLVVSIIFSAVSHWLRK